VLSVKGGTFISALDPRSASCRNEGLHPVLVSDDCMLASPIILYDYPQVASESQGDLFDATEIDEILTLRILTLSDQEKEEIRRGDSRARALLERTENLTPEQLSALHGAMRGFRPGDRVRLKPKKRADIFDIALAGRIAIIESIESDYDDNIHFAVVVEDDPGREFGEMRYPGHRFFFSPEEVEPL
jgi:hypothetical protein